MDSRMHHADQMYFLLSSEHVCPYLEAQNERKIFTLIEGETATETHEELSLVGFRRSQNMLYRPLCLACDKCISVRIPVKKFIFLKSLRRVMRKNTDLYRKISSPTASAEQFALFQDYVKTRHSQGEMADMNLKEYTAMIEETAVKTHIIEYRLIENNQPTQLVACALSDVLQNGFSMVYSFFDPSLDTRSLGRFLILDHIQMALENGLDYVYLGYWVKGAKSMDYKSHYRPLEGYIKNKWQDITWLL